MVLTPDVQSVHGNVAISGSSDANGRGKAAADDATHREYEQEKCVGLANRAICTSQFNRLRVVVDLAGHLTEFHNSVIHTLSYLRHGLTLSRDFGLYFHLNLNLGVALCKKHS